MLVDTGFLVAVFNKREPLHHRCLQAYQLLDRPPVTCEAVITEALHLLRFTAGAAKDILASIEQGALEVPFKLNESAATVERIMKKYADTPCDLADACLIAMADQLDTGDILTLDGDFEHYRWRRNRSFRMLIPLD